MEGTAKTEQPSAVSSAGASPHHWRPGQSGNPLGSKVLTERANVIFAEVRGDFAADLSAVDTVLLRQACRLLARGERLRDAAAAVKLSSEARRLITALRQRAPKEDTEPTLDPLTYAAGRDREAPR